MGFIIWYKVKFHEESSAGGVLSQIASALPFGSALPFSVSNDVFGGKYILDANITLTMVDGAKASSFTITLTNLPTDASETLKDKLKAGLDQNKPLLVDIYLGYFGEEPDNPVMLGAVTSIKDIAGDPPKTEIKGSELYGYKLRAKCFDLNVPETSMQGKVTSHDIVANIVKNTGITVKDKDFNLNFENYTLQGVNNSNQQLSALDALNNLVKQYPIPCFLIDNSLYIDNKEPIPAPIDFDPDTNIVSIDQGQQINDTTDLCNPKSLMSYTITTLGHPGLRVGQNATLDNIQSASGKELRIIKLTHKFSTTAGYTCDMTVTEVGTSKVVVNNKGATGTVNALLQKVQNTQTSSIDIGEIKDKEGYQEKKHLATLNYGQSPKKEEITPSVHTAVNTVPLPSKPIASPFAWRNCGLIVPVYPGMRALLAHNRNLTNDAIVTGFLWPDQPEEYTRPKNEPGDYWLCLPTELDGNNHPTGKGANDLTDKSGLRVIEAKGLRFFVGKDKLKDVGERPQVPNEKTIVIEHESGTKITIADDGVIKIETQGKDISLTNGQGTLTLAGSGDISLKNSGVTLKLGSSGVEVT